MNNIHIKNPELLKQKISKIKEDGLNSLHFISDYDKTMTYCFENKVKRQSVYHLIRAGKYLTKDYSEKAFALFDKYHPYEISETLSTEEKSKKMQEWWEVHEKLLIKSGMNEFVIKDILKKYSSLFRKGIKELLQELNKHSIPFLILSAGQGNIIEGYLTQEEVFFDNVKVISNFFNFDKDGTATGYKSKIIHVFNKSEISIPDKYKKEINNRKNVILMGDSLADLDMSKGLNHKTIITIGFLNEKLNTYKNNFDIVITDDQDINYVLELLKELN